MHRLNQVLFKSVSIAPLVVFRMLFGGLLLYSTLRTLQKGWVTELYIDPLYHFGFFSWLGPLDGQWMQVLFFIMAFSAAGVMMGFLYRFNACLFFLLFAYCELIDKTYYLNHYYLVAVLTFWLILVPAHRSHSIDTLLFPGIKSNTCRNWHILIFKVQLSIVYFFAGLAKVNPDWLLRAEPMRTWLPGLYEIPLLGSWLHLKETAYLFSWAGCIYDLSIWLFLWIKRARGVAYLCVLVFHLLTAILFPRIGMFPLIMVTSTVIFFSAGWHQRFLQRLPFSRSTGIYPELVKPTGYFRSFQTLLLMSYVGVQLFLPLRYLQYSGNLFWHEQGYRFSWRVMLMEKNGFTSIIVRDPVNNVQREVDQDLYLTAFQKQQMKSQPDMILQFANYVGDRFKTSNGYDPEVYVRSRMSLNGRRSQEFTNPNINVYGLDDPMRDHWLRPFKE